MARYSHLMAVAAMQTISGNHILLQYCLPKDLDETSMIIERRNQA